MAATIQGKRIPQTSFTGHKGILLIEGVLAEIGWLFTSTTAHTDGGVDGFIEIRQNDTGDLTNLILQVQSKATAKEWVAETDNSFEFRVSERDIAYWTQGNTPVILVVSRPDTDEAYWVSVKDYFSSPATRKSKKVRFDKQRQRFDAKAASALFNIAAPVDSGLYSELLPKQETLQLGLLPVVKHAPHVYVANTDFKEGWEVAREFREAGVRPGEEWFLKEGKIFSLLDLRSPVWRDIVEQGTIEQFDANEWASTHDSNKRRDFVRLLNFALKNYLGARGIWRYAPKKSAVVYYFAPGEDKIDRMQSWEGAKGEVPRFVVKGIPAKKEPTRMVCYRHLACKPRFDRFGDQWYLVIETTYHFTLDGHQPSGYREEYLSGIKRLEGNQAVTNNQRFWVDALTRHDLFSRRSEMIEFGSPVKFEVDFGIPDEDWMNKIDPDEAAGLPVGNLDDVLIHLTHEN